MFKEWIFRWRARRQTRWWKGLQSNPGGSEGAFLQALAEIQGTNARDAYLRLQNVPRFIPPLQKNETIVVDVTHPKSAAVFYNRLWAGVTVWEPEAPVELLYWPPNTSPLVSFAGALLFEPAKPGEDQRASFLTTNGREAFEQNLRQQALACEKGAGRSVATMFGSETAFAEELQSPPTPVSRTRPEVTPSNSIGLLMTLDKMDLLDERVLGWGQILQFRSDPDARRKVRWFLNWLKSENVANKELSWIQDAIADRLEEYRTALKKHGLGTRLGMTQVLLSIGGSTGLKSLIEGALHSGLPLAPFAGAGALLGFAKVLYDQSLSRDKLDKEFREIAMLHLLKQ